MHTSDLRGADFTLVLDGKETTHGDVFGDFPVTRRVGLICPEPLDGLGAATLLLSCVTAFYDGYRATATSFFAYPDFFTFHLRSPASYCSFDIWPDHKNVAVDSQTLTDDITDRGVDTLIVPDDWTGTGDLQPVQQAALNRTLKSAFAYRPCVIADDFDLTISCRRDPVATWADKAIESMVDTDRVAWARAADDDRLEQSFRQLTLADAVSRL